MPTTDAKVAQADQSYEDLEDLLALPPKTDVLFISWNGYAKVGSQKKPGVTGKISLGEQNESGQKLTKFCQEDALITAYTFLNSTRDEFTHGHHQMVNTKIKLSTFFVAKDGEAVCSQQN